MQVKASVVIIGMRGWLGIDPGKNGKEKKLFKSMFSIV